MSRKPKQSVIFPNDTITNGLPKEPRSSERLIFVPLISLYALFRDTCFRCPRETVANSAPTRAKGPYKKVQLNKACRVHSTLCPFKCRDFFHTRKSPLLAATLRPTSLSLCFPFGRGDVTYAQQVLKFAFLFKPG